ncbi:helix-turn-helix transcriptional regulator [Cytobacillus firmus]
MFCNRIEYWTKIKGLKKSHLAKVCGVSNQTFSSWVQNKTQPDLKQSALLARTLGISLDDLISWREKE